MYIKGNLSTKLTAAFSFLVSYFFQKDAKERVQNSAKRYIAALENNLFET